MIFEIPPYDRLRTKLWEYEVLFTEAMHLDLLAMVDWIRQDAPPSHFEFQKFWSLQEVRLRGKPILYEPNPPSLVLAIPPKVVVAYRAIPPFLRPTQPPPK